MPTKIEIATNVSKFVVGFCAGATTKRVLKNNVEPENKKQEIETYIGAIAIGGIVAEAAEARIERSINSVVKHYNDFKNMINGIDQTD